MKIATYNVNSVNARLPVLLRWLAESRPDVACLQELKAAQEKFPADALRDAGYHAIWHGQKAWNGIAILARSGDPVVLAGDYNVIPEELDVYDPAGWEADALFRPETRAAYRKLLAQGWTDAMRHLNPGKSVFTFWDYTSGAWRRNAGLRIDHLLLNPAAAQRLTAAGVDRDVRGWEKTSDHAPTWVELRDG